MPCLPVVKTLISLFLLPFLGGCISMTCAAALHTPLDMPTSILQIFPSQAQLSPLLRCVAHHHLVGFQFIQNFGEDGAASVLIHRVVPHLSGILSAPQDAVWRS